MSGSTAFCGVGHRIVILSHFPAVFTSLNPKHGITNLSYLEMMITRHTPQIGMIWTFILRTIGELVVLSLKVCPSYLLRGTEFRHSGKAEGDPHPTYMSCVTRSKQVQEVQRPSGWNFRYRKLKSWSNSSRNPFHYWCMLIGSVFHYNDLMHEP